MPIRNVKKIAVASTDLGGLKSSRYEKLQVSYGTIGAGAYTLGDTLEFADVPSQDIIRATVIAHGADPAVLEVFPGSNNTGTFTLKLPSTVNTAVKLSYIIEYIRGTGRVGSSSGDNSGEGELFKVTIATSADTAAVAEAQVAGESA